MWAALPLIASLYRSMSGVRAKSTIRSSSEAMASFDCPAAWSVIASKTPNAGDSGEIAAETNEY